MSWIRIRERERERGGVGAVRLFSSRIGVVVVLLHAGFLMLAWYWPSFPALWEEVEGAAEKEGRMSGRR